MGDAYMVSLSAEWGACGVRGFSLVRRHRVHWSISSNNAWSRCSRLPFY